jgi:glucosamine--fructose-6-phosphate aminotransferase (isomerizing)
VTRSPLHQQVDTLPGMIVTMIDDLVRQAQAALPPSLCRKIERVFITGCGDSHHAAVNAEMAVGQLAGLPCRAAPAMHFGRYIAPTLPLAGSNDLLLAVSVSGQVSRTVEALVLGRLAGATGVAVTGSENSPLAAAGEIVLQTAVPPLPDELKGLIVPGARSYIASQLMLYVAAIQIGQARGHLSKKQANDLRRDMAGMADLMETTIAACDPLARQAVEAWLQAASFVYCGSGPNFGTALFSAAKLLEASGDTAVAQETEEWAHLEYFARELGTPTILISAGGRDANRTLEVATAARAIGRSLAIIAPVDSEPAQKTQANFVFPLAGSPRECFSPLTACLPGLLFAAYRAQALEEAYFRGFGGGRSAEGGGGISRIRTSQQLHALPEH